ncbi:hypothetical protein V6N12_018807 [Hibiscus sabdariffa]|uniref:Uncharacterized protein n=1 Tax=Hibiscus sabdariffa TaxID=183260 RepID=A0ABR2A6V1_9ROSI
MSTPIWEKLYYLSRENAQVQWEISTNSDQQNKTAIPRFFKQQLPINFEIAKPNTICGGKCCWLHPVPQPTAYASANLQD